jgi:ankyrin repeat protein
VNPRIFPLALAAYAMLAHGAESTPLLEAAYSGDAARVASLIKSGAKVDEANDFGATPMGEAARRGDAAVLGMLLAAGADPESVNAAGETALMAVARTGNVEAAKLLLKAGARIDAREKWGGQTPLLYAAAQNQPAMIRLLASKGADVNARSVVRDWGRRMTAEERPKDLNRGGMSPLMMAARDGHIQSARTLLELGAKVDLPDPDGSTALLVALMNGHWDVAKLLVDSGADVNLWDWWGQTPLYMAVDMNTLPTGARIELPGMDYATGLDIINLLLAKGANPNAQLKLRPPYRNVSQDRLADPAIDYGTTPLMRAA